jgi:hypothetical protein
MLVDAGVIPERNGKNHPAMETQKPSDPPPDNEQTRTTMIAREMVRRAVERQRFLVCHCLKLTRWNNPSCKGKSENVEKLGLNQRALRRKSFGLIDELAKPRTFWKQPGSNPHWPVSNNQSSCALPPEVAQCV